MEQGWDVTVTKDSVSYEEDDEQTSALNAAHDECLASLNLDDDPGEVTEEIIQRAYDREVASWDCLTNEGYTIEELPSYGVYKDRLMDGKDYTTWAGVHGVSEIELARLSEVCPDPSARFWESD